MPYHDQMFHENRKLYINSAWKIERYSVKAVRSETLNTALFLDAKLK